MKRTLILFAVTLVLLLLIGRRFGPERLSAPNTVQPKPSLSLHESVGAVEQRTRPLAIHPPIPDSPTLTAAEAKTTPARPASERGADLWPGAKVLAVREDPPLNGLSRRLTLLQPANFPYAVRIEEDLNQLEAPDEERVVRRRESVAGHVLVKVRPGQPVEMLADLARQFGGRVRPHPTAEQLFFVDLPTVDLDGLPRALSVLAQYPDAIEYAEPDAIVRAAAITPNDPRFAAEQWNLHNTGQTRGTADVDIDAPEAWDLRREATNIIVAIVDSGVRYTHEDLAANMWRNPNEIPGNGVDDDGNGFVDDIYGINAINDTSDPADDLPDLVLGVGGHGTSVAGVIGAVGNNGQGITGVAWKVQLMALKWFNNQGAGALSDAVQCLDYARGKGAHIVNASWQQGGLLAGSVQQSMVDALGRLRQAGIIFVSSAGNDGANNDLVAHYPSNYPLDNMVAVAAGTATGLLSRQSNFGERTVDLVAPGEAILSTTSKADNDYALVSGTSFAAPHVSGMLAILKAQFPAENYRTLINRLLSGAVRNDRLTGKVRSGASANLFNALNLTNVTEFPEVTAFTLNGTPVGSQEELSVMQGTNVTLAVTVSGTAPLHYAWSREGKAIAGATAAGYTLSSFAASDIGLYQVAISNVAGVATFGLRLLGVVTSAELANAVNATNRAFLASGNTLWDAQTTVTRDGVSAGASGRIAARQGTIAATTLTGPGKASFSWKVSSERDNDPLEFFVDGIRVETISGEVDWTRKEFALSPGAHELRWRYVKDASLSKGDDRGYLDQFQFEADLTSAPKIEVQPAAQSGVAGSMVFFSVVATGTPAPTYQWQKDGANLPNARSNRLDLVNVTAAAEGRYSVIVSNVAGTLTSASARLTVTPAVLPPRIVASPANRTADAGTNVTFTVEASGTPPLHYFWRKDTVFLPGQTNRSLTLSNVVLASSGLYSVTVSNSAGTDNSGNAALTVVQLQLAPEITKQPVSASLNVGERLELVVEATGLGPFRYEWTRDGQVLAEQDQPEFVRSNAQLTDAGMYQVKLSSPFGVTRSAAVPVRVSVSTTSLAQAAGSAGTPRFTWSTSGDALWFRQATVTHDLVDALQSGAVGDLQSSELTATAAGPGQVSFWWKVSSEYGYDDLLFYVDDELVDFVSGEWDWEEILWNIPDGTHTLRWIFEKDETESAGEDAAWLDEVSFVSFNTESPVVVRHPQNQVALAGGQATFEVEVLGSAPFKFQWFKDNVRIPNATNISLTLQNLTAAEDGFYHVAVSNQLGSAFSRVAYVTIVDAAGMTEFSLNYPGLNWTDQGEQAWFAQAQETSDGVSAMQSGPILHDQASWLATSVVGPGILYFNWKVSSEEEYDYFGFYIEDELWDYLSGEVDWEEQSILIPPGLHYLYWGYFKDESVSSGADAGWLDQVAFEPLDPLTYWKYLFFSPDELLDESVSGDDADPDHDGLSNFAEYAFDLDPNSAENTGLPVARVETIAQGKFLNLTYSRPTDDVSLTYEYQRSTDLITWTTSGPANWSEAITPLDNGIEEVSARFLTPIAPGQRLFFRVRVSVGSADP